jgi:16S rRNA (cytosine1402-N4)-methyltransferase
MPTTIKAKESVHEAVMAQEAIGLLKPQPGGVYIDATLGGGTHTAKLVEASAPDGRVLSLDVDPAALERARKRFKPLGKRWECAESNFRHLAQAAREHGFSPADGILFDLGLSSDELVDPSKGLSFQTDGPLDMRLGPRANESGLTAEDIVNAWPPRELERIFREYGEERFARRIAQAIASERKIGRIDGTAKLVKLVSASVPRFYDRGRLHPATRVFQALRIAVNDELGALEDALVGAKDILRDGGILAVISFHSLEDRLVKHFLKSADGWEILTKKPLVPSDDEVRRNPRARSAKLRAARKTESKNNKNQTSREKTKIKYAQRLRHSYDEAA